MWCVVHRFTIAHFDFPNCDAGDGTGQYRMSNKRVPKSFLPSSTELPVAISRTKTSTPIGWTHGMRQGGVRGKPSKVTLTTAWPRVLELPSFPESRESLTLKRCQTSATAPEILGK